MSIVSAVYTAGSGITISSGTISVNTTGIPAGALPAAVTVNNANWSGAALAFANLATGALPAAITVTNANVVAAAAIALSKLQALTLNTFAPANPTGTTTTGVGVMMGLGGTVTVTHAKTGKLLLFISGAMTSTVAGDGVSVVSVRYGTGTAPLNGAVPSGTVIPPSPAGGVIAQIVSQPAANGEASFSWWAYLDNSANLNIATWFDIVVAAVTGGTAAVNYLGVTILEVF